MKGHTETAQEQMKVPLIAQNLKEQSEKYSSVQTHLLKLSSQAHSSDSISCQPNDLSCGIAATGGNLTLTDENCTLLTEDATQRGSKKGDDSRGIRTVYRYAKHVPPDMRKRARQCFGTSHDLLLPQQL